MKSFPSSHFSIILLNHTILRRKAIHSNSHKWNSIRSNLVISWIKEDTFRSNRNNGYRSSNQNDTSWITRSIDSYPNLTF